MLTFDNPIRYNDTLKVFEDPKPNHIYCVSVDTSRGVGNDFSAFVVLDVTQVPYKVVATFRNNTIAPMLYPKFVVSAAKMYNEAQLLVEINDIGAQVADIIHNEYEYEGLIKAQWKGRAGQIVGGGFGGGDTQLGVRTTSSLKRIGCSNLKTIVESDRLYISDFDVLSELTTFVANKRGTTYEAEEGMTDDLAMCLVLFAWLTSQDYFKQLTDIDIRKNLYAQNEQAIEDELLPFGFIENGEGANLSTDDDEFKGGEMISWDALDYDGIDGLYSSDQGF